MILLDRIVPYLRRNLFLLLATITLEISLPPDDGISCPHCWPGACVCSGLSTLRKKPGCCFVHFRASLTCCPLIHHPIKMRFHSLWLGLKFRPPAMNHSSVADGPNLFCQFRGRTQHPPIQGGMIRRLSSPSISSKSR